MQQSSKTIVQNVFYEEGVYENATQFNGLDSYINLGKFAGSCISQLEFCHTFRMTFYLELIDASFTHDQYIVATTDNSTYNSGFYVRHGNLNITLPFRRYMEITVKYSNKIWTSFVNYQTNTWAKLDIEWNTEDGLTLVIDDQVAVNDETGRGEVRVGLSTDPVPVFLGTAPRLQYFSKMTIDELTFSNGPYDGSNVTYSKEGTENLLDH